MSNTPIRGRFAPSPSGRMHLGNVFSALLAWLSVKSRGGEMILRIEDLDRARCKDEYITALLDDLAFLGLSFDNLETSDAVDKRYRQSTRTPLYAQTLQKLDACGLVYPCYCSRDELHAVNAPHAADGRVIYTGACRTLLPEQRASKTRPPAYRVVADRKDRTFEDGLYGFQRGNVALDWGDFVIRRSDGMFAYQLAVVVDDADMGITEVVRGRDLLSSTFVQLQLYEQLGLIAPSFTHVPMLIAPDGRRLSKRDRDLDLGVLRQNDITAEELIGILLYMAGVLERPEKISAAEATTVFSWGAVTKRDIIMPPSILRINDIL